MSLSEQEQKMLREIEQSLLAEDPKFGSSVAQEQTFNFQGGGLTLKALAIGMVGLLMLIGGVALAQSSLWFVVLSVAGFLVMFGAGIWSLMGPKKGPVAVDSVRRSAHPSNGRSSKLQDGGFGSRMEENFRRRFEGS